MRFENLEVWKRAARLSVDLYKALEGSREFGFRDQVTRSALSVASNIAEGYERQSAPDRIKFLNYAQGSCGELRTQLYIGVSAGFLDRHSGRSWIRETRAISAMLCGLTSTLRSECHRRDSADN